MTDGLIQMLLTKLFTRKETTHAPYKGLQIFALVLALTNSLPALAQSAADSYEKAQMGFNAKNYTAAIIHLKNALQVDPGHLPSRILIGKSLIRAGDAVAAEKYLLSALAGGADDEQVIVVLGSSYLIQGKHERLLREIRSGSRATDIEMQILVLRAQAQLELGKVDDAETSLKRARRLLPQSPEPILGLATVEMRRGRLDEAVSLVAEAERFEPDTAAILFAKGEIARLSGDPEQAVDYFDRCLEKDSQHQQARKNRAAVLLTLGKDQLARADIEFVRSSSPDDPQAIYLNAMLLARSGSYKEAMTEIQGIAHNLSNLDPNFVNKHAPTMLLMGTLEYLQNHLEKAEDYLKRYLRIHPHHLQPRQILAEIMIKRGDSLGATTILRPMLAEHPDNAELLILLGTAYLEDKSFSTAAEFFEKAAALEPDLASVRTRLALSRLGQGETDAAMQDLEMVLQMNSGTSKPGLMLALLQLRKKQYHDALVTTEALKDRDPGNPMVFNLAATAQLGTGNIEAARKDFEMALRIYPDFAPALLNLASLDIRDGDYASAGARYQQILRRQPTDIRAMAGLSKIAELEKKLEEAITWLEKLRNAESGSKIIPQLTRLARLYLQDNQPEQALQIAKELGHLIPSSSAVLDIQGRAFLAMGDKESAARFFRIIYQGNPESPALLHRLGLLLMQADDLDSATKAVEAALAKDPSFLPAKETQVILEMRNGRHEQAHAHARQLQKELPDLAIGYRLMGDLLMQSGDFPGAAEAYAEGLTKQPRTSLLLRQFRSEHAAGHDAKGLKLLNDWLKEHPGDKQVHDLLGILHQRAGRLEAARHHYETLAKLMPENALILNNLAGIYQKLADPEALQVAQRAHQLNPEHPAINDTLGWILVQQGQASEGLQYLRQAQARAFSEPAVRYHLAAALNDLGRKDEARQEIKAALADGRQFEEEEAARALLDKLDTDQ